MYPDSRQGPDLPRQRYHIAVFFCPPYMEAIEDATTHIHRLTHGGGIFPRHSQHVFFNHYFITSNTAPPFPEFDGMGNSRNPSLVFISPGLPPRRISSAAQPPSFRFLMIYGGVWVFRIPHASTDHHQGFEFIHGLGALFGETRCSGAFEQCCPQHRDRSGCRHGALGLAQKYGYPLPFISSR